MLEIDSAGLREDLLETSENLYQKRIACKQLDLPRQYQEAVTAVQVWRQEHLDPWSGNPEPSDEIVRERLRQCHAAARRDLEHFIDRQRIEQVLRDAVIQRFIRGQAD